MKKILCLSIFVVSIFCCYTANGTVMAINLEKMTNTAGKVFAGRCVEVRKGVHPQYQKVKVTFVTLEVSDVLKGDVKPEHTFMQFGHGNEIQYMPEYKKGEESFLFLYPESPYGFTSPVGAQQGLFTITTDSDTGKRKIIGALSTSDLLKDVDKKYTELAGDGNETATQTGNNLTDYETFSNIVKHIINSREGFDKKSE